MGQVLTVPDEITDFSAEGTKVLFCKELNVTSDEDDEKKGIKRTYEDRQERRRNGRYKRHCSSEDYGDELASFRPPSRCSVSSEISPRYPRRLPIIQDVELSDDLSPSSRCSVRSDHRLTAKRLPKRLVRGKEKSKPASNRNLLLTSSHQKESKSQQSQDSIKNESANKNKIIKVPGDTKKYQLEDNEEVTIYEKTIITVTSSDNYLMGDPLTPMCRYKSGIPPIHDQKIASVIKNQFKPASIGVYGTANKNSYRKDMLNRDASVTRSKNIHILPVIQELNNIGDDSAKSSVVRSGTKTVSSTYSKLRDLVKSPQRSTAMTPNNMNMLESKIQVRGFQSIPQGSTLFPNSCMKKETIRTTTSKKSVRFMVSESQCNMGGESIPKKSFRLEKFPPVIPIRSSEGSNLTAAPVVMTIQNPTLELMKGNMRGEVMENIICRETAQRVIQEQLINKLGIIQNINSNGSQSVHLLNGPSVISVPGEPFKFAIGAPKSTVNCVQKFTAISQKRTGD
uniref:33 kDa chaperonin n=1 Tax=Lygus hesperus TaxID=30085 RepID=A0A0A9WH11_LYGHE